GSWPISEGLPEQSAAATLRSALAATEGAGDVAQCTQDVLTAAAAAGASARLRAATAQRQVHQRVGLGGDALGLLLLRRSADLAAGLLVLLGQRLLELGTAATG